jgi:hypothetical protein
MERESLDYTIAMDDGPDTEVLGRLAASNCQRRRAGERCAGSAGAWAGGAEPQGTARVVGLGGRRCFSTVSLPAAPASVCHTALAGCRAASRTERRNCTKQRALLACGKAISAYSDTLRLPAPNVVSVFSYTVCVMYLEGYFSFRRSIRSTSPANAIRE